MSTVLYNGLQSRLYARLQQVRIDAKQCPNYGDVSYQPPELYCGPGFLDTSPVRHAAPQVLSAGLVFSLCRNTEHADNRSDYLKQFAAER